MLDEGVINGNVGALACLAVIGGKLRCLQKRRLGDGLALGADNHMRAVNVLGVEPHVGLGGGFERQLVVLAVVSAHQHHKAVGGHKLLGRQLRLLGLLALWSAEIALLGQLLAYLAQLALRFGAVNAVRDRFQIGKLRLSLFYLLGKHCLGGLCLLIILVIFLRVGGRRNRRIQPDLHQGVVLVIKILHLNHARAALNAVEIRVQQIACDAQLLAVAALRQLRLLLDDFARGAVNQVCQQLLQAVALDAHTLSRVALLIKFVHRRRKALGLLDSRVAAVLPNGHKAKVHRSAVLAIDNARRLAAALGNLFEVRQHAEKLFSQNTLRAVGGALAHTKGKLARHNRRHALYHLHQRLGKRHFSRQRRRRKRDLLGRVFENIQLFLRVGQLVFDVGQHKAAAAHRQVNALDGVDNHAGVAVYHNQVAVHAHDFADNAQSLHVAQLVDTFKIEKQHAVAAQLPHADQLAAAQPLAQQHAEHRRLRRIFGRFDTKIDARRVGARRQQQLFAALIAAQNQHQLVAVGLIDLADACAERGLLDFFFDMP